MRYISIITAVLISSSALAGDFKLTHGKNYSIKMPTVAHSYDGKARDVSKFYKPTNKQFYIGGKYTFNKGYTNLYGTYDNGFNSSKYNIDKSFRLGVSHTKKLDDNLFVSIGGHYKFGGEAIRYSMLRQS